MAFQGSMRERAPKGAKSGAFVAESERFWPVVVKVDRIPERLWNGMGAMQER